MRTEPWWTCHTCGRPVQRVGSQRKKLDAKHGHRQICAGAGYSIEQWRQDDLKKYRR